MSHTSPFLCKSHSLLWSSGLDINIRQHNKCRWIWAVAGNRVTSTITLSGGFFIHLPISVNCGVSAPFGETGPALEQLTTFCFFTFFRLHLNSLWVKKLSGTVRSREAACSRQCRVDEVTLFILLFYWQFQTSSFFIVTQTAVFQLSLNSSVNNIQYILKGIIQFWHKYFYFIMHRLTSGFKLYAFILSVLFLSSTFWVM